MKTNTRKGGVCGTAAVLTAMSGLAVCGTAHGQLTVSNNFTQNGGTLAIPNGPNKLTIGGAGNPTLTLTNGANGNAASALFIGRQAGHSGTLVLEQSSQMVLNPNGPPSTYASIGEVTAGSGTVRVRTNALLNSTGTLIVGELGSARSSLNRAVACGRRFCLSPLRARGRDGACDGSELAARLREPELRRGLSWARLVNRAP